MINLLKSMLENLINLKNNIQKLKDLEYLIIKKLENESTLKDLISM